MGGWNRELGRLKPRNWEVGTEVLRALWLAEAEKPPPFSPTTSITFYYLLHTRAFDLSSRSIVPCGTMLCVETNLTNQRSRPSALPASQRGHRRVPEGRGESVALAAVRPAHQGTFHARRHRVPRPAPRDGATHEYFLRISRNTASLYPGPLSRKIHFALLSIATERGFPLSNPITWTWRDLCRRMEIAYGGQKTLKEIKRAIRPRTALSSIASMPSTTAPMANRCRFTSAATTCTATTPFPTNPARMEQSPIRMPSGSPTGIWTTSMLFIRPLSTTICGSRWRPTVRPQAGSTRFCC